MRTLLLIVLLLGGGEVIASQVFHQKLEEALTPEMGVFRARVVSARVEIDPGTLRVIVQIDRVDTLRWSGPLPGELTHEFSTLLGRADSQGNSVRVSPLRDGSGLEQRLQPGRSYLFLVAPEARLVRAEPESSVGEIERWLKLQEQD